MQKLVLIFITFLAATSCLKQDDYHIDISYTGEQLRYISCPLGGIGTGNLQLSGYGAIRNIEIFNFPAMDAPPPAMTCFYLYTKEEGSPHVVRIMEREFLNEYPGPFGKPGQQLGGLPRFREAVFHNAYPFVKLDLLDDEVPLEVTMTAWSPFIPVDPVNSSLPVAVIEWSLTNTRKVPVDFSVAFSMENPMQGVNEKGKQSPNGCMVSPTKTGNRKGFTFSSPEEDSLVPGTGDFRVLFPSESKLSMPIYQGRWSDAAQVFWEDFSSDGTLELRSDTLLQEGERAGAASMYLAGNLAPGETMVIPVLFAWHIPYRGVAVHENSDQPEGNWATRRNYYTELYPDIDQLTEYLENHLQELKEKTRQFSEAMITSSVPAPVLDAAISNVASLKTNLIFQDSNGHVYGFEGLGDSYGTCSGSCSDAWNFAQTISSLFPSFERNMHENHFIRSNSNQPFPEFRNAFNTPGNEYLKVAVDEEMARIMRVYANWKKSGDNEWLGWIWPAVKQSLEFAWKGGGDIADKPDQIRMLNEPWDPNKEGVLRGEQYTSYDINLYGPNMMTGSFYLGALKACAEMAMAMNEPQKSIEYLTLLEKGTKRYMELLWNGEYFIQDVEAPFLESIHDTLKSPETGEGKMLPKYQYGDGCLSSQLSGQYLAFLAGLGYLMDTSVIRMALSSIYKNNFIEEIRNVENLHRIFAANDEPGLVNCSWPFGGEPFFPMVCSDEVWTGVEYQVAASLIYAELPEEGLRITEAARSRYQGANRNPFAEIESGRNTARAMSSWSVYEAMAGYHYDGTRNTMTFDPADDVLPVRFFWSAGSGWGTLQVSRAAVELRCLHGSVDLQQLNLQGKSFFVLREFIPSREVKVSYNNTSLEIIFPSPITLEEGEVFEMVLP